MWIKRWAMFLKITFCGCVVKGKQEDGRNSGFLVVKKNVPIFGVSGLNLDRRRGSD